MNSPAAGRMQRRKVFRTVDIPAAPRPRAAGFRVRLPSPPGFKVVYLWPSVRKAEWKGTGRLGSKSSVHRVLRSYLDATVQAVDDTDGYLEPEWCEALMGWPQAQTDLVDQTLARESMQLAAHEAD